MRLLRPTKPTLDIDSSFDIVYYIMRAKKSAVMEG
jgi:hypothetical protein